MSCGFLSHLIGRKPINSPGIILDENNFPGSLLLRLCSHLIGSETINIPGIVLGVRNIPGTLKQVLGINVPNRG